MDYRPCSCVSPSWDSSSCEPFLSFEEMRVQAKRMLGERAEKWYGSRVLRLGFIAIGIIEKPPK